MTDPKKDEHIEELLSKLQGIFGKLSHSEEEEAKQTIEVPHPAPKEPKTKDTPPAKKAPPPEPLNLYAQSESAPAVAPASDSSPNISRPPAESGPPLPGEGAYETLVPTEDPERAIIPTAVYFPLGRENEAKSLAGKLETMAPKFTKVAFRLRVIVFMPYDPKSDWKDTLVAKAAQARFQTVFVAVERPMDDSKKKSLTSDLEVNNVYLQEVPISSIEKKAFYTDILLGLVFFFDSRKPPPNPDAAAA
jgi:hypothetical protein